ncbi:Breast cancer type 1 susceptibility protein like [Argiope bruennichi]|uniref:Breast cancer type 1 susceptibility protein like n=1 Tax=Argiope bruennichi TaxID=94029 RepID=A0A8T0FUS2_ARGBR|nr:Breast cancer type 1 susceptibility protein like [Argiope bruennichi]
MMKSSTENVVDCVNAILKTLECSICLELLKNPVSTGCGHFFCRFCITETLQSNYRAPCPLCKKSFTRRGIQDAHQRKSILLAAKRLADVCEQFADVKFFNKECSQREVIDDKTMPILTSFENQPNVIEKATRTSSGRKRKSNEKEKEVTSKEMNDPLPVLEKIGSNKIDIEPLKNGQYDSSNDEVIPTSNKRCRQSVEDSDSDSDALPDLESIFQDYNVPKISDEYSSNVKNNQLPPTKNDSAVIKTSLKNSASILPKKNSSHIQNADKSSNQKINNRESNRLKVIHKRRFKAQNLKEKNKSNPLRNKTNELNIDDATKNNTDIALNATDEVDKNINSVVLEKIDETERNEETFKENKHTNDVALFLSPEKDACIKSDLKNHLKKTKTPKSGKKDYQATSSEEENLIVKLNEAENFELTISKNTIPSTVLVKKYAQSDDIADTAISVQTVASPETNKAELGYRSPGWSKVKRVGKDFRVKKFSKLSVEKNMSHSCPVEITSAEQTKSNTSSCESLETPKFKKLHNSNMTKDINNEDLSRNSDATKNSKNSLSENEAVGNKQLINSLEQMSDGERQTEMTAFSSELNKYDNNSLANNHSEMDYETKINLQFVDNENCTALNESREVSAKVQDNITAALSNGCSLLKRHNLTSVVSTDNHILPDFHFSSISGDKNENLKSIQNNILNTEANNKVKNKCMNGEVNFMEVDNFNANDEYVKQSENETSHNHMLEKEIALQIYPYANLHNEEGNLGEINSNPNFQDHRKENVLCYVDNVLSSEKSFLKPDLKILPNASIINDNKSRSRISKISKCEITATKSIFDKDENVYYTEHSQQTSQRLLEFCNDDQRKQHSFMGPVAALNVPFYYAPNTHGIVAKRNWHNQIEKFNPMQFGLAPQNNEKTKVLKRTCLTLDEIQEAFTNSSTSGETETICSLPFSSGDYRLHVCVSEETLNISVLKVVDSKFESPNVIQTKTTVAEKNIQTSNNNSQINSPVEILPSSNAASDSSQPDQGLSDGNSKMKNNIFPYLNMYFPDSESGDQPCPDVKESLLNNSEIIPYQGSKQSLNINDGDPTNSEEVAANNFLQNDISLCIRNNTLNSFEVSNNDENYKIATKEICVAMEDKTDTNIPKLNDSSESLPPTQPYLGSNQNSAGSKKNDTKDITGPIDEVSEKSVSSSDKIFELTDGKLDGKLKKPNLDHKTNQFSKREESDELMSDDDENINFDDLVSYQKISASPNNLEINDSDGLSSDPAMAFATQLVAPLKNIAAKMNSAERINNLKKQTKEKSSPEVLNSREKRSLQEFEELVFNLSKNSTIDSSVSKSSRLSLKSKRAAKKFKRIQKFDSDDDSDSAHSSKDELCIAKHSSTKDSIEDVQAVSSKVKGNELTCESLQEQSTLNSFLSEDITNKDPNQLVREVEVLDKEIYSVVEQLKQYGREDVLKHVLEKLHTECEKESSASGKSDKNLCISDDSEDSTDIFSQSVPPTPPDNETSKNDTIFKSSLCKHN